MSPNQTARSLARGGVALAHRPLTVAAYAVGMVKGTVEGAAHAAESLVKDLVRQADEPAPQSSGEDVAGSGERTRYGGLNTEAAPPMTPGGGGEAFEHEPTAESRDVAHGDADVQPREVESWAEEADATEEAPDEPATEPLLDPAIAKAVRSEAETLRKAADPNRG